VAALLQRAGGPVTSAAPDPEVVRATRQALPLARAADADLQLREVVRLVSQLASVCNRRVQESKPWENPAGAAEQAVLYAVGRSLTALALMLQPIMPRFSTALAAAFGEVPPAWSEGLDPFDGKPVEVREKPPQIARLEARQVERLIAPPAQAPAAPEARPARAVVPAGGVTTAAEPRAEAAFGVVQYQDFAKLELRVGAIRSASLVEKADRLLRLSVDLGEPEPRTIVAGIALAYPDPAVLVGMRIVVVANLAPRPLRGITSQGMLLAAGEPPGLQLVTVGGAIAPGTRVK
jgi:methionyl-tRNA synthetase